MPAETIAFLHKTGAKVLGARIIGRTALVSTLEVELRHENWVGKTGASSNLVSRVNNNAAPDLGRSGSWAVRTNNPKKGTLTFTFSTDKAILAPALEKILRLKESREKKK